jgi:hypothetical protein
MREVHLPAGRTLIQLEHTLDELANVTMLLGDNLGVWVQRALAKAGIGGR